MMNILPTQCTKQSEKVTNIRSIIKEANEMIKLCRMPLGKYPGAFALAHCQVDHENPKRFFVMNDGELIINPEIIKKSLENFPKEGCMSFPDTPSKNVLRYDKITVRYRNEKDDLLEEECTGLRAHIFQHEIDHFNGISIYS